MKKYIVQKFVRRSPIVCIDGTVDHPPGRWIDLFRMNDRRKANQFVDRNPLDKLRVVSDS